MGDRAAFVLLVTWVLIAPVFLGSVAEAVPAPGLLGTFIGAGGGYALFCALGGLAAVLLLPGILSGRREGGAWDRRSRRQILLLLALPLLGLLQLLPLPRGLHGILAPAHAADLEALLPGGGAAPLSTDPGLTLNAVVFLGLLFLAGVVVRRSARGPLRAWTLLGAFVAVAAIGAAYGLLQTHLLGNRVLSHSKGAAMTGVTGTFFYRGNFCAFSAAALGVGVAAIAAAFRRGRPAAAAGAAMAVVVLAAGLLLSNSRAGILALAVAILAGTLPFLRTPRRRFGVVLVVLLGVAAAVLTSGSIRERFGYLGDSDARGFLDVRVPAWESTLDLAEGRLLLGSGLGCYRRAIHLTQSDRIPDDLVYAHSDPLNLLAEGGVAGLLIGGALLFMGVAGAFRLARRDDGASDVGAACAGGLLGMLTLILMDFPLQVPATALVFIVLLLLPAAADDEPRSRRKPSLPARSATAVLAAVVVALAALGVARGWGKPTYATAGERLAAEGTALLEKRDYRGAIETLVRARNRQPFEGVTRHQLAAALFRAEGPGSPACLAELRAAHRLGRGMAELLYRVGEMLYRGYGVAEPDLAASCFREAGALDHDLFRKAFRYFGSRDPDMVPRIVPDRDWAFRLLGIWHESRGKDEEAVAAYVRALDLGAGDITISRLVKLYRRSNREAEGRELFAGRGLAWPEK